MTNASSPTAISPSISTTSAAATTTGSATTAATPQPTSSSSSSVPVVALSSATRKRRSVGVTSSTISTFPAWLNPTVRYKFPNNTNNVNNNNNNNSKKYTNSSSVYNDSNNNTHPITMLHTTNASSISSTTTTSTQQFMHKLYRMVWKGMASITFLLLVVLQFQWGQITITKLTKSSIGLLPTTTTTSSYSTTSSTSSSTDSNNNPSIYDFLWPDETSTTNRRSNASTESTSPTDTTIDDDGDDDNPDETNENDEEEEKEGEEEENVDSSSSLLVVTYDTTDSASSSSSTASATDTIEQSEPATTTTNHQYQRPSEWKLFPRWNTTTGIPIEPLIQFIFGIANDNATTIETATIRNMFPETLYIFDTTNIYTSYTIRERTLKTFINDRVKPTERIMKLAHMTLINHMKELTVVQAEYQQRLLSLSNGIGGGVPSNTTVISTSLDTTQPSLKLLRRKIRRMENRWSNLQTIINEQGSFPFIAWYGDFTGCNYRNWKRLRPSSSSNTDDDNDTTTRSIEATTRIGSDSNSVSRMVSTALDDDNDNINASSLTIDSRYIYESIPLFTTCSRITCEYAFPLPTYKTIQGSLGSTFQWKKQMQVYQEEYPSSLDEKIPKLVWRGSLTGDIQNYTNTRWLLCKYVTDAPYEEQQYYDIGLTKIPPRHDKVQLNLTIVGDLIPGIFPMAAFQNYRAILDIDGNSWSSRFGSLLCYHSVIIKVEPMYVDYFHYTTLIPNVHYIPVHYNLSNLYSQTVYVMDPKNNDDIQRIIRNANSWCQQNMVFPKIANDYLTIFDQYVQYLDTASSSSSTRTDNNEVVRTTGDATSSSNWKTKWNHYKEKHIFTSKLFNMVPLK